MHVPVKRNAINIENGRRIWRDSNGTPSAILGEVTLTVHSEFEVTQSAGQTASWRESVKVKQSGEFTALVMAPALSYWTPTAYIHVPGIVVERHTPSGFGGYYGYGNPGANDKGKPGSAGLAVRVSEGKVVDVTIASPYGCSSLPEGVVSATFTPEEALNA